MTSKVYLLLLLAGTALSQYSCGQGWLQYQDTCVLIVSNRLSFFAAQQYCQNQHSDLAIIKDQQMNDWLQSQIKGYSYEFWIGLLDREGDSVFKWVDGTPVSYTNWSPGEPNDAELREDCVEMYSGNGLWNDEQCLAFAYFFCAKKSTDIPKCDVQNQWQSYGGKCYRWLFDQKTHFFATEHCNDFGGYLISVNSEGEQDFAAQLQGRAFNLPFWMGLSDKNQARGTYIWEDGTDTSAYDNWALGEPDSSVAYPGCARTNNAIQRVAKWSIQDCEEKYMFICETDEGTCADGWILHGGQCYQYNTISRTWYDAKYYCEAQGGWLATITSGAENMFIASNMDLLRDENIDSMWIGLSDTRKDGTFEWEHQILSPYDHWLPGKPNNTQGVPDCAYMDTGDKSGTWYQKLCTLLGGFVCKIKAGSIVTPVDPHQVGSCERGWALHADSCYYSPSSRKTPLEARQECQVLFPSSDLVSIHSAGEQSFITERLANSNAKFWIGLNDLEEEGNYVWFDGTPYDFQNWANGQPDNSGDEDCVQLLDEQRLGLWNDVTCDRTIRFICKMPKYPTPPVSVTPPLTLSPSDRCGNGWIYDATGNNCYKYVTSYVTWQGADNQCHFEGGKLTSIASSVELDFIVQNARYYRTNDGINAFWIGLHDMNIEGGYEWSDGSPLAFLNWNAGEPNDMDSGEDCVEAFSDSGKWNDLPCDRALAYICKRNGLITQQFTAYPNSRLQTSNSENPVTNLWPEECAYYCYALGDICRSFNYRRSTRECTVLYVDKDSSTAPLVPEFEDPWDHYQRDFSGPPYVPQTTLAPTFGCGQGEYPYRGFCYTLVDSLYPFNAMRDMCGLRSSDLVSIADKSELNFVISLMQTGNQGSKVISEVWLGLTDMEREGEYAWTDGSPVTYTKWATGQPANLDSADDCVVHNYYQNGWRDVLCTGYTSYGVCKREKRETNVVPPPNDGCPGGWQRYMSSCYQFVNDDKKTWADAKEDCYLKGAKLATITSDYEQAYLASQMGAIVYYTGDYWIGLSDTDTAGTYKWVDGSPVIVSAWAPGQPDDTIFGQCVAQIGGIDASFAGMWMDENCDNPHNYICEKLLPGATETPYTQGPPTPPSNQGCTEEGAIGYGSNCFIVFEKDSLETLTWSDARTVCLSIGGDLASFHSEAEENYLVSKYTPIDPSGFWIGLHDMAFEGGWEWSDGTAVSYVNWAPGEPNNVDNEDCAEMILAGNRDWFDMSCTKKRSWVCKKPKQIGGVTTLPPIGVCPSDTDWNYVPPYCYYHSDLFAENDRLGWNAAEQFCLDRGSHLASIEDEVENELIRQMAPPLSTFYWIGLRQYVREGPFIWSDGSPLAYTNWAPGEPNNNNGEELCVQLYQYNFVDTGGMWNDASCGVTMPFICKKRYGSPPPTPRPTEPPFGGCSGEGYFKYFNKCYRLGGLNADDQKSWYDARDLCQTEGGDLASIHGKELQAFLTSMLINVEVDVWTGLNAIGAGGFRWNDGSSLTYTNWYPGEPSTIITIPGTPARECVELLNAPWYAGMWNDAVCDTEVAYVCQKDLEPGENEDPPPNAFCSDGSVFYQYGDSCFLVQDLDRTWDEAQEICASYGANLASIPDGYHEAFVEYLLFESGVRGAWIGMSRDDDGQYTWIDEWPIYFTKWGENEPSQRPGDGCVLLTDDPAWDDTKCSDQHPFVCRKTDAKPPPPVEDVPGYCPPETEPYGSFCYYVPEPGTRLPWYTSRMDCQAKFEFADLASIHSKDENEFIRKLIYRERGTRTAWLGLERSATGGFQWTDKTPFDFAHWGDDEPSDIWLGQPENCGEMYTDDYGMWNDEDCHESALYVCKVPKYQNETSTEPVPAGSGLATGAIVGIVIASVFILTTLVIAAGLFMGSRSSSKDIPSTTASSSPAPTGFDNVIYKSEEQKEQVTETSKKRETSEA